MRTKFVLLLALVVQAGCQSLPQNSYDRYHTAEVGMRGSNR
jgi:hypothetical protein